VDTLVVGAVALVLLLVAVSAVLVAAVDSLEVAGA
jgi:hypothetical protein